MNCTSKVLQLLLGLICFVQWKHVESKEFMRCELTKELINNNFDRTLLSNWVCMIEHESQRNTSKINPKPNKTLSYGLFQINSKEWCRPGRKGGICNAKCEDFIDERLTDDVACAKAIFNRDGFQHWQGWVSICREVRNRPDLNVLCRINQNWLKNYRQRIFKG